MSCNKLYKKCEDFFDLISVEYHTDQVNEIIDHIFAFLNDEIDGSRIRENLIIAEEIELQLKELWVLIPIDERNSNNNLCDYYDDLMEFISDLIDHSLLKLNDDDINEEDLVMNTLEEEREEN